MRKTLTVLLIALALLSPVFSARAQGTVNFSSVEVALWPEYDRSAVLVIYRITLAANTTLPANVTVRLPAVVGEPNAVALKQPDGQLFTVQYERQTSGDWQTLSLTATMLELQIEYYDPSLSKNGSQRNFTYTWPADHAVDSMRVEVQQPFGASDIIITPGPVTSAPGSDGLTYFNKEIGAVAVNQTFTLEASYQKSTDALTVEAQPVEPVAPLSTTPAWQTSLLTALPWLLGALGIVLIGGGIYWYWRSGQQNQVQVGKPRTRRGRASAKAEPQAASNIYCHQCGNRAGPEDAFCRSCGAKLRLE